MNNSSETNWAKLDAMRESAIDTSDIPPLTEEFFNKSRWWKPVAPSELPSIPGFVVMELIQNVQNKQ